MYHNFIFLPLYNGLVGIMDLIPGVDVGVAVIIFTCIVRLILFPLSKSALLTQVRMKDVEPEVNRVKAQYSADKQVQAMKIMELYKEKKIKPFSSILLVIIQLPILFALISVFYKIIPTIDQTLLYSFISVPDVTPTLFGLDLTSKSLVLALVTAVIQYLQLRYSVSAKRQELASANTIKSGGQLDTAAQLAGSMNKQMKYFLPVLAFASVYWIIPASFPQAAAIIAIYWSVSSLFTLIQELYIEKKYINN
ncbi:MAG: YidC/Oxa1 family membrane protein insertase [Candidatus Paceibacterota bacterium]|jgi:YidC/Oxa1 family membrane protein insertase